MEVSSPPTTTGRRSADFGRASSFSVLPAVPETRVLDRNNSLSALKAKGRFRKGEPLSAGLPTVGEDSPLSSPVRKRALSDFPEATLEPQISSDAIAAARLVRLTKLADGGPGKLDDGTSSIHNIAPTSPISQRINSFQKAAIARMEARRPSIAPIPLTGTPRLTAEKAEPPPLSPLSPPQLRVGTPPVVPTPKRDLLKQSLFEDYHIPGSPIKLTDVRPEARWRNMSSDGGDEPRGGVILPKSASAAPTLQLSKPGRVSIESRESEGPSSRKPSLSDETEGFAFNAQLSSDEEKDQREESFSVPVSVPIPSVKPSTASSPTTTSAITSPTASILTSTQISSKSSPDVDTEKLLYDAWLSVLQESGGQSVTLRENTRTVDLMEHGVPPDLRCEIWTILSGAREERQRYQADYYHNLVQLCEDHGFPAKIQIAKDITRTLPGERLFQTEAGRGQLERVLSAYCLRNPESVGYCQSMNQIGGTLLTVMKDEENAFWALSCLIESKMGYYSKSMCGLLVDQLVFQDLLAFLEPAIYDHLKKLGVSTQSFTVSWFLCLFVEAPLDLQSAILFWDYLFLYGDELLFQMAIAIFKEKKSQILQMQEDSEVLTLLLHGTWDFDIRQLMSQMDIGVHIKKISALRDFHQSDVIRRKSVAHPRSKQLMHEFPLLAPEGSETRIQALWKKFLGPTPWKVLIASSISDPVMFYQAFCREAFVKAERNKWRDKGLFSGLLQRVMEVVDKTGSGQITFEEYLEAVNIFQEADQNERAQFAFRFCDFETEGSISRSNLIKAFDMLHLTYHGEIDSASSVTLARLIFQNGKKVEKRKTPEKASPLASEKDKREKKTKAVHISSGRHQVISLIETTTLDDGIEPESETDDRLHFEGFRKYIVIHPLMVSFFGLDPAIPESDP